MQPGRNASAEHVGCPWRLWQLKWRDKVADGDMASLMAQAAPTHATLCYSQAVIRLRASDAPTPVRAEPEVSNLSALQAVEDRVENFPFARRRADFLEHADDVIAVVSLVEQ